MKKIKRYTVTATLKNLDSSILEELSEEFSTETSCISFMKEINMNRCWKQDTNLKLIGKPTIICH